MAEYSFRFTEQHLVTTASRLRQQARSRFWRSPLKLICFIGLGGLFVLCAYNLIVMPSVVFGVFLVLLAAGPRLDYWVMKWRFRSSPFYNSDIHVSVTSKGYVATDTKSRVELAWSAFTKATRFPDGFLVLSGPHLSFWWPDAGLTSGSISEVESLLRGNVAEYHGI
jgi:hypothetical protein